MRAKARLLATSPGHQPVNQLQAVDDDLLVEKLLQTTAEAAAASVFRILDLIYFSFSNSCIVRRWSGKDSKIGSENVVK
jgi:hypothetical protein